MTLLNWGQTQAIFSTFKIWQAFFVCFKKESKVLKSHQENNFSRYEINITGFYISIILVAWQQF